MSNSSPCPECERRQIPIPVTLLISKQTDEMLRWAAKIQYLRGPNDILVLMRKWFALGVEKGRE